MTDRKEKTFTVVLQLSCSRKATVNQVNQFIKCAIENEKYNHIVQLDERPFKDATVVRGRVEVFAP